MCSVSHYAQQVRSQAHSISNVNIKGRIVTDYRTQNEVPCLSIKDGGGGRKARYFARSSILFLLFSGGWEITKQVGWTMEVN